MDMEREAALQRAIEEIVLVADGAILDTSDGSVEETNYLTCQVTLKFMEKVNIAALQCIHRRDLLEREGVIR